MQDASFADLARAPAAPAAGSASRAAHGGALVAMAIMGYIPLLHAVAVLLTACFAPAVVPWWAAPLAAAAVLYLVPPAAVRVAIWTTPLLNGSHAAGSRAFLAWWFCMQWQVLFNRLPLLEEALRLVPSLYSLWLRLWGARVGRLVYWSPRAMVIDRQLIDVGDRAVVGLGACLCAHFVARDEAGKTALALGRIRIGHDAIVAGWSLLAAGSSVEPFAVTRPGRPLRPFMASEAGDRVEEAS